MVLLLAVAVVVVVTVVFLRLFFGRVVVVVGLTTVRGVLLVRVLTWGVRGTRVRDAKSKNT